NVTRSEAVMTATLMSFLWFALAVIWVFVASTAWRAWVGLCVPGVLMAAGWLILRGA
ncbi:MAG TPA: iron transporter, partial [Cupriavidus sp.]|nr:iron transporter [Cupriavidus sp.]